jgi:hypothetical protein
MAFHSAQIDLPWAVLLLPLAIGFAVLNLIWRGNRARRMVDGWARKNGIRVLECNKPVLLRGPFTFTTSKSQVVFRVMVELPDGRVAGAWLRCGSWLGGLLSNEIAVRWDQKKREPPGFPVVFPDRKS